MPAAITIEEILREKKKNEVYFVGPDTTVYDALSLMAERNIGSVLVLDEGKLIGIFTERDYARKIILCGKCSMETPVSAIMSEDVITVSPDLTIDDSMALMNENRIRHLPVIAEGTVIGMISVRDLVEAHINQQQKQIDHLENYISGSDYGH